MAPANRNHDTEAANNHTEAADDNARGPHRCRRQAFFRRQQLRGADATGPTRSSTTATTSPPAISRTTSPKTATPTRIPTRAATSRARGGQQNRGNQNNQQPNQNDDDGDGRGGRRGRRFRERRRRGDGPDGGGGGGDTELRDDDVVQPVAGILDVLDNYAFVRTSGYLAGPHDVYVSMNMVRKNGLRRGDAVTGAVRVPKDGEQPNQRQKFNPLVRLDTVNGGPVEDAKNRPDFTKLTPLYPNQRLRLETSGRSADHPGHRPDHADRQGSTRADRVAAQGG